MMLTTKTMLLLVVIVMMMMIVLWSFRGDRSRHNIILLYCGSSALLSPKNNSLCRRQQKLIRTLNHGTTTRTGCRVDRLRLCIQCTAAPPWRGSKCAVCGLAKSWASNARPHTGIGGRGVASDFWSRGRTDQKWMALGCGQDWDLYARGTPTETATETVECGAVARSSSAGWRYVRSKWFHPRVFCSRCCCCSGIGVCRL